MLCQNILYKARNTAENADKTLKGLICDLIQYIVLRQFINYSFIGWKILKKPLYHNKYSHNNQF